MLSSSNTVENVDEIPIWLADRVFHVTTLVSLRQIQSSKAIFPNDQLRYSSEFGCFENGYFRNKKCVSFFDYRNFGSEEWRENAYKCIPTLPLRKLDDMAILFLKTQAYSRLIAWKEWKKGNNQSLRIVPYIEAGYPGEVPLEMISEIMTVQRGGS